MAAPEIAAPGMTPLGMSTSWDGCFLGWLLLSIFADFEQVKKFNSYFADFEQVKKTGNKTPVGETECLCIFSFSFFSPTQPCHLLLSHELLPGF